MTRIIVISFLLTLLTCAAIAGAHFYHGSAPGELLSNNDLLPSELLSRNGR